MKILVDRVVVTISHCDGLQREIIDVVVFFVDEYCFDLKMPLDLVPTLFQKIIHHKD